MEVKTHRGISKRITESIPAYFFVYNIREKKITYLTDSFRKYVAEDEDTKLESVKATILPEYHLAFDTLFNELDIGNPEQDIDLKTTGSKQMPVWVNIRTFRINESTIAGQVSDISLIRKKEDRLKREADKKEVMLHLLMHDLRSPVSNIREFSRLLQKSLDQGKYEEAGMYSEIMQRLSLETEDIMSSLTEMIEMDTPDFGLKFSPVDLCEIIEQLVENYSIRHAKKNLQVNIELPDEPLQVSADATKIRLVFQNILSNAIKFTPNGGQILVKSRKNNGHLIIAVKDSGIGIPVDKLDQIFEQFTRMKRKGTNGEKSSGLGLSLAKKIVEMHGGEIEVESAPGAGSTFRVSLPLRKGEKANAGLQKQ